MSGALPTVSWEDLTRPAAPPAGGDLTRYLPAMPQRERPGWLGAGIAAGYQNLVGSGGSAIEAVGRAAGLGGVERYGRSVADYRAGREQEVGRSDLQTAPWREGGSSVLPWLGYNVAQQVPNLALTIGAFIVGGPGGAAAAAARGGGLRAGLNASAAALGTSPGALLATASMIPSAAGSMYGEAVASARATTGEQDARPGQGEALAALGLSPLYAAAEALPTARLMGIQRGMGVGATSANRAMRGVRGAAEAGIAEFGTEGVQTALEQAFRPDLTIGQRANNVLDGALTGLAVGGVLGGGAGLASRNATRAIRDKAPSETTDQDLTNSVDSALNGQGWQPFTPGSDPAWQDFTPEQTWEPFTPATADWQDMNLAAGQTPQRISALAPVQMVQQALVDGGGPATDSQATRRVAAMFDGVSDEIALAAQVRTELYNESLPTKVRDRIDMMAIGLGFDAEGNPRDLAPELATARAEAQAALASNNAKAAAKAAAKIESLQRAARVQQGLADLDQRNSRQPLTEEQSAGAEQPYPGLFPLGLPIRGSMANPAAATPERVSAGVPLEGSPIPLPPPGSSPELPLGAAAPFQQSLGLDLPAAPATRMTSDVATLSQRALAPPGEIAVLPEQRAVAVQPVPPTPQPGLPGIRPAGVFATPVEAGRVSAGAPLEGSPIPQPPAGTGPTLPGLDAAPTPVASAQPALDLGSNMPWRDRVVTMMTLEGASEATQERARRWLIEYDAQGMRPGMQQRAQSIVVSGAREVGVRRPAAPPAAPTTSTPPNPPATSRPAAPATPAAVAPAKETARGQEQADAVRKGREGQVARPAAQPATPPSSTQRTAEAPKPAASSAAPTTTPITKQEAKRREIAARNAVTPAKAETADPPVNPKQRVNLTPQQRDVLQKITRSKVASPDLRRAALDALNAPTVGKVQAVMDGVRAEGKVVSEARAANAAALAKLPENQLKAIAADPTTNAMMRNRVEQALALPTDSNLFRARADAIIADHEHRKAAAKTEKDAKGEVEKLREIDGTAPTRRGALKIGAALAAAFTGRMARAQTAGVVDKLKAGDLTGALDVIAETSTNPAARALARRLAPLMGEVELRVVEVGKDYPRGYIHPRLNSAYGLVTHNPATGATTMHVRVDPTSRDVTDTMDETVLHEALHAAIMSRMGSLSRYGAFITRDALQNDGYFTLDPNVPRRAGDEHILQILRLWKALSIEVRGNTATREFSRQPGNAWLREAASDPDEFVSYALTSPQFQEWMKAQRLNREGYWTRFVRAVGGFLGFGATRSTYLEAVMDASNSMLDAIGPLPQGRTEQFSRTPAERRSEGPGTTVVASTASDLTQARLLNVSKGVADADRLMRNASTAAQKALDTAVDAARNGKNVSTAMRAQVLYATTLNHIARVFGRMFPTPADFQQRVDGARNLLENASNINRRRAAISAKFAELFRPTWAAYERLESKSPELAKKMRWLMEIAAYEIDPRKKWDEQTWLHDKADQDKYQRLVREANQTYAEMREGRAVFDNMATFNQMQRYASMSTLLSNIVVSDPTMRTASAAFADDPMSQFLNESALAQQDVQSARDWWKKTFEQRLNGADQIWRDSYAAALNAANKDPAKQVKVDPKLRPTARKDAPASVNLLGRTLFDLRKNAAGLQKHPYFHLGRTGDYFASFTLKADPIRTGEGKRALPDLAAAEKLTQALEAAGFDDFSIPAEAERNNVFLRVETPTQLANLERLLAKLQGEGVLADLKAGHRDEPTMAATLDAKFLQDAIARFSASTAFDAPEGATAAEKKAADKNRERAISQLREAWINMLPASSESRVMTARKVVPGWSKNMMTSYAFRANVGNLALANLSTSAQMSATLTEMRKQLNEAQTVRPGADPDDKIRMQQVMSEMLARETNRPMHAGRDMVDSFRAVNYAFFLGMSPAYMLNNLTQVGVTLWPELAKKHGFVKSARAVASATGLAIRIMAIAAKQGFATSTREALEPGITQQALDAAKVPKDMQEYLLRLINTGVIDIGAAARELGRLAETNSNGKLDTVLRYAGAFGLYSEAAVRLASGIALRTLDAGKTKDADLVSEAVRIIDDTMFNYTEANIGRALGRSGVAGRFTPIATAFQQFNAQMLEKLYREFYDATSRTKLPGESDKEFADRKTEARRFLASHAAAITVLAGSLGLPFVTAIAAAVNNLKDLFDDDDEPFDVQASWRNFLSSTLGKDLGEVAARGLPRAFGFDMSGRVGEQNILPLSRFLADRRKWEDAFPEQAERMLGAPFSMVSNVVKGVREMAAGNVGAGMQAALPIALRAPVTAFRMAREGYTNDQGVRLPMEPGAASIVAQALGYTPGERAEYGEAQQAQTSRRGVIVREATNIRNNIAKAIEKGDQEGAREWLQEARRFDRNNPAYAVLPSIGGALQQRQVARARADALDVPLGVSLRDVAARERTAFANF